MAEVVDDNTRAQFDDYAAMLHAPEDAALRWVRAQSAVLSTLSIQPIEGRFLQWLAQLVGARRIVEIGTCLGYSGIWLARALSADGTLFTLEKDPERFRVALEAFERAGVSERVVVLGGDARTWLTEKIGMSVDMVFIDADKGSYPFYLEWAVQNVRPGGLVVSHNAMRDGLAVSRERATGKVMDDFNRLFAAEERLNRLIVPVGDGFNAGIRR